MRYRGSAPNRARPCRSWSGGESRPDSRAAAGLAGCHRGYVTDLARIWLDALGDEARGEVAVYACGPVPMLEACVDLAREYSLPCRVSLEEYMACAVGGCAGCAVRVRTGGGRAMKRVCIDGPVFDGHAIVFGA